VNAALSIKSAARIANLSIDTIRAWEKRYRAVVPERAHGGQRVFSTNDVERLVLLREIVSSGTAISRIANCTTAELRGLTRVAAAGGESDDADVMRLLRAVRAHDVPLLCEELLSVALVRSAAEFGDDVIVAVLTELERDAEARHTGELLLASALVSVSATLLEKYRSDGAMPVVSLTLPGEAHAIPPLLSAVVSTEAGFLGMYVGTQIEPADVEALANDLNASVLVMHAGVESFEHMQMALRLRERLPDVRLVVTGRGARLAPSGLVPIGSLRELAYFLQTLSATV
jgi:MerR family transcriptional regulator, light-induced transcriptional regulator